MEFRIYNEGNNSHEKKQLSYQNLTNFFLLLFIRFPLPLQWSSEVIHIVVKG